MELVDSEESTGFEPEFCAILSSDKLPEIPLPSKNTSVDSIFQQELSVRENTSISKGDNSFSSNEELALEASSISLCQASALPTNSDTDSKSLLSEVDTHLDDFVTNQSTKVDKSANEGFSTPKETQEKTNTDSEKCNCLNDETKLEKNDIQVTSSGENVCEKEVESVTSAGENVSDLNECKAEVKAIDADSESAEVVGQSETVEIKGEIENVGELCGTRSENQELDIDEGDSSNMLNKMDEANEIGRLRSAKKESGTGASQCTLQILSSDTVTVEKKDSVGKSKEDQQKEDLNELEKPVFLALSDSNSLSETGREEQKSDSLIDGTGSNKGILDANCSDENHRKSQGETTSPVTNENLEGNIESSLNGASNKIDNSDEELENWNLEEKTLKTYSKNENYIKDDSYMEKKRENSRVTSKTFKKEFFKIFSPSKKSKTEGSLSDSELDQLKKESLKCDLDSEVLKERTSQRSSRKRIFSSGENRDSLPTKTVLVKDMNNAETMTDIYCFDGSDDSFNEEKQTITEDPLVNKVEKTDIGKVENGSGDKLLELYSEGDSNLTICGGLDTVNDRNNAVSSEIDENVPENDSKSKNEEGRPQSKILQNLRSKVVRNMRRSSSTDSFVESDKTKSQKKTSATGSADRSYSPSCDKDISDSALPKFDDLQNSKIEEKAPKKRGRKPKSEKTSNRPMNHENLLSKDNNKSENDAEISFKVTRKKEKENIDAEELDLISVACLISESEHEIHKASPTRSGRKSYKKLNKEFVYEHISSSGSDIEYSPVKKSKSLHTNKISNSEERETVRTTGSKDDVRRERKPHSSPLLLTFDKSSKKTKFKGLVSYKCNLCDFESVMRTHFKEHCCMHLDYKPIQCELCGFQTCRKNSIICHSANLHGGSTNYKYIKDVEHEKFVEEKVNDSRKFVSKSYIKRLRKGGVGYRKPTVMYVNKSASRKSVKCPLCSFCSHSDLAIRRHAFWKHNMCKYQCPKCKFSSLHEKDVLGHFRTKHGKSSCSPLRHLGMMFVQEDKLNEDQNLDQKDESVSKLGRKNSKRIGNFMKKIPVSKEKIKKGHTRQKFSREKCPVCSYTTMSVLGVKRHMFFQHRLCSWSCSVCFATFSSKDEAVSHSLSSHIGVQPSVSRILPQTPSKVARNGKDIVSAYSTFKKSWMEGRPSVGKTKRKILSDDVAMASKEMTDVLNPTESQTGIGESDLPLDSTLSEQEQGTVSDSNTVLDSENKEDNIPLDVSSNYDVLSVDDSLNISNTLVSENEQTVPKKKRGPGRPKKKLPNLNENNQNQVSIPNLKKRGKKRKLDRNSEISVVDATEGDENTTIGSLTDVSTLTEGSQLDDANLETSRKDNEARKKKHKYGSKMSKKTFSLETQNKKCTVGTNTGNLDEPVVKKKRGPKPKNKNQKLLLSAIKQQSLMSSSQDEIIQINSDVSFDDKDIDQGQMYDDAVSEGSDVESGSYFSKVKKKSKLQTITTVADIHRTWTASQFELKSGANENSDAKQSEGKLGDFENKKGKKRKVDETTDNVKVWTSWKSSSYALHPKKLEKVKVAYSCPYCNYAAPLRHQLRLHCYGRHTDRPACLIEFKNKRKPGRPKSSKSPVSQSNKKNTSPKQIVQSKVNFPEKLCDENVSEEIESMSVPVPSLKKSKGVKKRFCNPMMPMVKHLNDCRVRVYDTFHSCVDIDDIDHYLDKFGVRTLNMDMLTPKQFSKFMSKFGGNLQGVDL